MRLNGAEPVILTWRRGQEPANILWGTQSSSWSTVFEKQMCNLCTRTSAVGVHSRMLALGRMLVRRTVFVAASGKKHQVVKFIIRPHLYEQTESRICATMDISMWRQKSIAYE